MPKSHAHAADFRRVLKLFGLLGHPLRTVIVQRLEEAELVHATLDGKRRVYRVNRRGFDALTKWIARVTRD